VIGDAARALAHASPGTAFARAFARHQAGELNAAAKGYTEVLQTEPKHFDTLHMLGVINLQTGNAAEALRLIDAAIAVNGQDPVAFNHRGAALLLLDHPREALASFDRALALDPSFADAYKNRGDALRLAGHCEAALAAYDQALTLAPDSADVLTNKA